MSFKLQLHLSECFSNFRQGGMTGGAALRKEIYLIALTSGPIPDYLLQLYVPRPSQGRGYPCTVSYDYNFRRYLSSSYWKTEKGVHSYIMLWKLNHPHIPRRHISFSGQQKVRRRFYFLFSSHLLHIKFLNLQRNWWSVTYLSQHGLATWIYPAKIELFGSISITWGKLLITLAISPKK